MDSILFLIQGSAVEPYQTSFYKQGSKVTAFCTCPAGVNGKHCKHRLRILAGQATKDIISKNESDVATVAKWIKGSDLERAINDLAAAEKEIAALKNKTTDLKKEIVKVLRQ